MPPILRSFTIFQDAPSVEESSAPKQMKPTLAPKRATRSPSSSGENFVLFDNPPITALDKENLHPVTGERAGLTAAEKKRKDNSYILATKLHNPPSRLAAKKHKKELSIVLKDEGSPTKKRKASTPSQSAVTGGLGQRATKGKPTTSIKEGIVPAKPRKTASTKRVVTRTRTISTLPKVAEEPDATGQKEGIELKGKSKQSVTKAAQPQLSQADIDSRCYELTVKPLADVSQAYEDSSASQDVGPGEDKAKFQTAKVINGASMMNNILTPIKQGPSVEAEIRDYCPPAVASSADLQLGSSRKSPFEEPSGSTKTFSTPERKAIYAAFTFSSPSPSGERFSKTTRVGSIPRLELA